MKTKRGRKKKVELLVVDSKGESTKEVKSLHESIFWDEDDPRRRLTGIGYTGGQHEIYEQFVDLAHDAYIFAFTGTRGAGKSLAMTYFAAKAAYLYNARLVSNYPIAFMIHRIDGKSTYHESEPLDLYKLLCFDTDYQKCIILIDEAPDIISHMSSMTWKNRLLNIFVRQIRKNMNTLFMGAQQFSLIDKSMRWQTDILVRCQDAFRLYGGSAGLCRGACILLDMYDNSGQWTGHGKNINYDGELGMYEPDDSLELSGKVIWGAYDTYYQQDVFESLRRVDIKLGSYEVGDKKASEAEQAANRDLLDRAAPHIEAALKEGKLVLPKFYRAIGNLDQKQKAFLGHRLREAGAVEGGHGAATLDMSDFDWERCSS